MKTTKSLIFFILLSLPVLLLMQCTEKVDIKLAKNIPHLVVDGMITNEAKVHVITLTASTDYFYTLEAPAVTQANVTISNGTSTVTLIEKPANSGIYETAVNYSGTPGKKYTLNIILKDAIAGETVFSAGEVMPISYHPDSIKMTYHEGMNINGYWETELYIKDPPGTNYYSFRGYRNDKLVTGQLSAVSIEDDKFFNGLYINGLSALSWDQQFPNQNYKIQDKITLQVGSITRGYYTFINEVQLEVAPKNPLFSGPSSNVSTNISNGGIGYFAVCAMSYVSTVEKN